MAGGKVGAAIRNFRLDEIFVADEDERVRMERSALQDIVDQAKSAAIETGRIWGMNVMGVGIASIEMPEEVQEEFLRRWGAPWRGWQALIEAEAKRRVAVTEARGEQEVSRLQADANKWKVVTEALAKLEATTHRSEAAVRDARARSDAKRIQARAEAEAETVLFEELLKRLEEALGRDKAIEILKETVRQRLDIDQIRRIFGIIGYPYWRDLGSAPGFRQLGRGTAGREEESEEEEPEEPE
jgi:regulator of protease activity HflC (stomatin/prohibitin superfamily)